MREDKQDGNSPQLGFPKIPTRTKTSVDRQTLIVCALRGNELTAVDGSDSQHSVKGAARELFHASSKYP